MALPTRYSSPIADMTQEGLLKSFSRKVRFKMRMCAVFCVILACPVLGGQDRAKDIEPFRFSHALHLEQGLECTDCHSTATASEIAQDNNLPTKETCLLCHEGAEPDSCGTCHQDGIEARTLENRERFVKFSHRIHSALDGLPETIRRSSELRPDVERTAVSLDSEDSQAACSACHRGMEQVDFAQPSNLPLMSDCLLCHSSEGDAMKQCGFCHEPAFDLLPPSHREETFFDSHSAQATDNIVSECRQCHTPNFNPCTQCH